MRKARTILILVTSLILTACSTHPAESESAETTEETTKLTIGFVETTVDDTIEREFSKVKYEIGEPEIIMPEAGAESGNRRDAVFFRDGMQINAAITTPEGKGTFKTIIISGGLYSRLGRYTSKAEEYCKKGYVVIEFDFINGEPPPSYADPEYIGDFIFEQILDLNAVLDESKLLPQVDTDNIYLYGHSMGGLVASYVGTQRQDDLKGLILVDPSFYATALMEFEGEQTITTDINMLIGYCDIPVVIITGTTGSFGEDPHFFDEQLRAFPDCEFVIIEGANHRMDGMAGKQVVERSDEVLKNWGYEYSLRK